MCPDFLLDVSSTMIIESASTAPTAAAGTANVQPIKQGIPNDIFSTDNSFTEICTNSEFLLSIYSID